MDKYLDKYVNQGLLNTIFFGRGNKNKVILKMLNPNNETEIENFWENQVPFFSTNTYIRFDSRDFLHSKIIHHNVQNEPNKMICQYLKNLAKNSPQATIHNIIPREKRQEINKVLNKIHEIVTNELDMWIKSKRKMNILRFIDIKIQKNIEFIEKITSDDDDEPEPRTYKNPENNRFYFLLPPCEIDTFENNCNLWSSWVFLCSRDPRRA